MLKLFFLLFLTFLELVLFTFSICKPHKPQRMKDIMKTLEQENPCLYGILQEQLKHQWEILKGDVKNVPNGVDVYRDITEAKQLNSYSDCLCPAGVKF